VLANVAPADTHALVAAFLAGDVGEARRLQLHYLPLIRELFAESNPIPVKQAVGMLGFDTGPLRLPLVPSEPPVLARLERTLREAGVAPVLLP
jgi:4-hydroxy-tetrahydrodipicolinate synthase